MEIHQVKRYRHLFFDLDHTLWDFEANSRWVLAELHGGFHIGGRGIALEEFIAAYEAVNASLWARHEAGNLPKETLRALRFNQALQRLGIKDAALASRMEEAYMDRCPRRPVLVPGAMPLLEDLQGRYHLHIITNGFTEVQQLKMNASGIRRFFKVVLTSEMAGVAKPSLGIFRHALRSAGASAKESLMIGDNAKADVAGARGAGLDQVHYAPLGHGDPEATFRITHLDQLRAVLP